MPVEVGHPHRLVGRCAPKNTVELHVRKQFPLSLPFYLCWSPQDTGSRCKLSDGREPSSYDTKAACYVEGEFLNGELRWPTGLLAEDDMERSASGNTIRVPFRNY